MNAEEEARGKSCLTRKQAADSRARVHWGLEAPRSNACRATRTASVALRLSNLQVKGAQRKQMTFHFILLPVWFIPGTQDPLSWELKGTTPSVVEHSVVR